MKREILFRGKRVDNGEWVEGSLVMVCDGETLRRYPCIVISYNHDTFDWHEVIPETVGQFTGLTDKNEVKIFDGNIVKWIDSDFEYLIVYENGAFRCYHHNGLKNFDGSMLRWGGIWRFEELCMEIEVVGNIHQNPELLKQETNG